jgi:P-type Ca2+ transporter type 2C
MRSRKERRYPGEAEKATAWHALAAQDVFAELDSGEKGLSAEEVETRRERYGTNTLPSAKPPSLLRVFLRQFLSPLIYILIAAAGLSIAIGDVKDSIFIFAVIMLNAVLGTYQEWKALKSASELQDLLKVSARVRRDGSEKAVDAEELVPGDIVLLESGDKVPADLRLVGEARNLRIDESLLTGESHPSEKSTGELEEKTPVSDRANMAFAGSVVAAGRGMGVVAATGMATEVGKIAEEVTGAETSKSPLLIRMERFTRQISYFVMGVGAVFAAVYILLGTEWSEAVLLTVALLVSAIPEGLPVAVTVALSIGTSRMAERNVIVRRLSAVESLGSCTCIASDKTGTLTMNEQMVRLVALAGGADFEVSGSGYSGEGEVTAAGNGGSNGEVRTQLERLARVAVITNGGRLLREDGEWRHQGDAMDVALLALGFKVGLDPEEVRESVELVDEIPFESERKYEARLYREGSGLKVGIKGAPEVLLDLCCGEDEAGMEELKERAEHLTENGYRVLAVAEGDAGEEPAGDFGEESFPPLELLGLVAMIDPLRPEAKDAVAECAEAGVKVVMVTGDNPGTAFAVAEEAGIAEDRDDVITGKELEELASSDPERMAEAVNSSRVFARVAPLQKVDIVQGLLDGGHFVAVTGDGVNDAPALRRANIGVAMGSGTDVAKDTAEIIIADDNFASIVAGIEQGRFAYENIRKVIYLLISTGLGEIILFTMAVAWGLEIALVAVQLLWLNLVTNGIQGVALAFEAGEPGAMSRSPRDPEEGIFNPLMLQQVAISSIFIGLIAFFTWWWLKGSGWEVADARNLVLLLMVLLENVHVFNCRSEYLSAFRVPLRNNRILILGVLAAQGIHIVSMYIPFMQDILGVSPVTFVQWLYMLLLALILLVAMEAFKLVRGWITSR